MVSSKVTHSKWVKEEEFRIDIWTKWKRLDGYTKPGNKHRHRVLDKAYLEVKIVRDKAMKYSRWRCSYSYRIPSAGNFYLKMILDFENKDILRPSFRNESSPPTNSKQLLMIELSCPCYTETSTRVLGLWDVPLIMAHFLVMRRSMSCLNSHLHKLEEMHLWKIFQKVSAYNLIRIQRSLGRSNSIDPADFWKRQAKKCQYVLEDNRMPRI